jgi:hypothetical protein
MKYLILFSLSFTASLNGFAQTGDNNGKIDSVILKIVKDIRDELNNKKQMEEENKRLKNEKEADTTTINRLNSKIDDLNIQIAQIDRLSKEFNSYKQDQTAFLEQEIRMIIKHSSKTPKDILIKYSERAERLAPKNKKELSDFIDFCDTINSIKMFFEKEYNAFSYRIERNRWAQLSQSVTKRGGLYPTLIKEVKELQTLLDDYCKNTNEVFSRFKKVYYLRNDRSKTDAFAASVKQTTYYAMDYPYLYNLIAKFINDSKTQDDYSDRKVICE